MEDSSAAHGETADEIKYNILSTSSSADSEVSVAIASSSASGKWKAYAERTFEDYHSSCPGSHSDHVTNSGHFERNDDVSWYLHRTKLHYGDPRCDLLKEAQF